MHKNPLIPVKKQIKGKSGGYQAIRWISASEQKRKAKEYVESREKASKYTKYISSHPYDVEVYSPEELRKYLPVAKNGKQYYTGPKTDVPYQKKSVNVDMIKQIVEFHIPIAGCHAIIEKLDGGAVRIFTNDIQEKKINKKFVRVKYLAKHIDEVNGKISQLMDSPNPKKSQLGCVLRLMTLYDFRVSTGGKRGGVTYAMVKPEELKPNMVIRIPGAQYKEPFKVVYKEKGNATLSLIPHLPGREKYEGERHILPPGVKEFIREGHYGATTLEARHVTVADNGKVFADVIGKSGVRWKFEIEDKHLAKKLAELKLGEAQLGKPIGLAPQSQMFPDVNRQQVASWLKKSKVLPHDFRKLTGTETYRDEINNYSQPATQKELEKIDKEILGKIAEKLHNTPGVVKSAYVDPAVRTTLLAKFAANIATKVKRMKKSLFVVSLVNDFVKARSVFRKIRRKMGEEERESKRRKDD